MNRRKFIELSSVALAAGKAKAAVASAKAAAPGRPNFLFFIADDLMFRTIHSINNPEVHTPGMDRLVKGGAHFTHCFHSGSWTGAVCVASRTMLHTGLSPFKAQKALPADRAADVPVWGQTLRKARLPNVHHRQVAPGRSLALAFLHRHGDGRARLSELDTRHVQQAGSEQPLEPD